MKHLTLIACIWFISTAILIKADQGLLPMHLTGVRYSTTYEAYAVFSTRLENGVINPSKGFVQVFDSDTNKLIWSTNKFPFLPRDIFLSDDGNHIACVKNSIQRNWYDVGEGLNAQIREEIENSVVLVFYQRDEMLKSYTVKELGLKAEDVDRSLSRFSTFSEDVQVEYLSRNIYEYLPRRNPLILGNLLRIIGVKDKVWYFDISTGLMLDEEPDLFKELSEWDKTRDPFGFDFNEEKIKKMIKP
jgi:hypothetical protein